jgi:RNA polymerase sigma-70 factor (ECF subfamily)|tara:strand:+ start:846 stop:1340 length:495 start_codon:yes stop_codon:yes gene_type:complete
MELKHLGFENIYKKYHPSLVKFAAYLTHSDSDAMEIVNDVFISVWQKRDMLELNDELKSYLFQAVKNKSYNYNKKKKLVTVDILPHDKPSKFSADHNLLEKEQEHILTKIMNTLPPKCQQIFAMSRIDQLSYKEISTLLDISPKTVEAQMTKALKIFRKKLKLD